MPELRIRRRSRRYHHLRGRGPCDSTERRGVRLRPRMRRRVHLRLPVPGVFLQRALPMRGPVPHVSRIGHQGAGWGVAVHLHGTLDTRRRAGLLGDDVHSVRCDRLPHDPDQHDLAATMSERHGLRPLPGTVSNVRGRSVYAAAGNPAHAHLSDPPEFDYHNAPTIHLRQ